MDIHIIVEPRLSGGEMAGYGKLAEAAGIGAVWVSSLLDSRDPFVNFVPLALATDTIRMGPIATNPFDTHPVRITSALLSLNELAGGRANIVVGAGGEALEALGIEPKRRVRAVRECVELMHAALSGDRLAIDGELYEAHGCEFSWAKASPPRIYVGANMPQMLRMAADVSDGIMLSDLPVSLVAGALDTIRSRCEASGRTEELPVSNFIACHLHDDIRAAHMEARPWLLLRGLMRPWVLEGFLEPSEVDLVMAAKPAFAKAFVDKSPHIEGVSDAILTRLVDGLTLVAGADGIDSVIEHLEDYARAGLSEVALRIYGDPTATIRLLGERVVPAVADIAA